MRLPDGETGIRKTWIQFLQDVLAENPAIEVARDVPPFRFVQWDGKLMREIPRLRLKPGAEPDPASFKTGYADMAIASWGLFDRLQKAGVIPANVKFQVSLPTPIAPTYNNMVPADRPGLLPALTRHFIGEVARIAAAMPNDRLALQWDVCQEVLAWEGYYDKGPVDFRIETLDVLTRDRRRGAGRRRARLSSVLRQPRRRAPGAAQGHRHHGRDDQCHRRRGQAADPVLPYAGAEGAHRRRLFRRRSRGLKLRPETELYLGLIHHDDAAGDAARLAAARRHVRVDGIATECGMARGDPARLPALLAAHVRAAQIPPRKRPVPSRRFRRARHPDIIGANNNAIPASKERDPCSTLPSQRSPSTPSSSTG